MIVIIDNYDSFTYNLVQYFKQMTEEVLVFRNDRISVEQMEEIDPHMIVLSPGPGHPSEVQICREIMQAFGEQTPILGICLGHQVIVDFYDGKVTKGDRPMQGKVTPITHDGKTVFENIPSAIEVTRYHSLQTPAESIPHCLVISAMSDDGVVMAVRHQYLPVEGIQFHPESIRTEYGYEMLENAYRRACDFKLKKAEMV
ncbi:aminodeoxychorismate/anthranilate synthase component II [Halobacillus fulvus]|nr:aminodeoxychorismate/anthranilate synthase component II [Halobacillus fulvus]